MCQQINKGSQQSIHSLGATPVAAKMVSQALGFSDIGYLKPIARSSDDPKVQRRKR